jgi:hypothetical protein
MKAALLLWESGGSSSTSIACWTPCVAGTRQCRDLLVCWQRKPRKSPGVPADAPTPGFPGGTTTPLYAAAPSGGDLLLR